MDSIFVPSPVLVSLKQIAAWDLDHLKSSAPIVASVPALQRGLVWNPQQVELLWDSILRGFPIGSFVVSKKIEQQERIGKSGVTHHLLDGQQRCNAITLGFADPFAENPSTVRGNKSQSILWLDLAPLGTDAYPESNLSSNSTRQFLTRVTTLAHPWGFYPDEDASRLGAAAAREAVAWEFKDRTKPEGRPTSTDLFPWHTNAPVPLSWLLAEIEEERGMVRPEGDFWRSIEARLTAKKDSRRWPELALGFLKQSNCAEALHEIYQALCRVIQTRVVIMEAPPGLLTASRQEHSAQAQDWSNITSIEHLFQRLNSQGTALDGEELAYSMIKAYWPSAADAIDSVEALRFPASHLVSLAVRAALTPAGAKALQRPLGLSRLRSIAMATERSEGAAAADYKRKLQIEDFLQVGGGTFRLKNACRTVDRWLAYDRETAPHGLPPVLISAFARESSPIYLFFLHLADRLGSAAEERAAEWRALVPGAATLLQWFGKSDEKQTIADLLMESISENPTPERVRDGVCNAVAKKLVIRPREPDDVSAFIQFPEDARLKSWRWWHSLIGIVPEGPERDELHEAWWPFLERTAWKSDLLLFAQRQFLATRFPDYDPSRKDLWQNKNRPWDFDHLHASAYFYNKRSGEYGDLFRERGGNMGGCIGNLRAWPFEDNRSDNKELANGKITPGSQEMAWSLICDTSELTAFSHGDATRHDAAKARVLCEAIKARYIRIYRNWYESAGISGLLPKV